MLTLIWLAAAAAALAGSGETREPLMQQDMAPARSGDVAIREELCAARKAASIEAYDLFIARHPEHPLAEIAREERARIQHKKK